MWTQGERAHTHAGVRCVTVCVMSQHVYAVFIIIMLCGFFYICVDWAGRGRVADQFCGLWSHLCDVGEVEMNPKLCTLEQRDGG